MRAEQFDDWLPIRVYWEAGRPMVDWCHMGGLRFTDPFFDETIERRLNNPFALLFRRQTPLDDLLELQVERPGLPPAGLIFHLSRCGSTLVSQMLAALPHNIVLSEAGPIDGVLQAHFRDPAVTDEQRITWLRAMVSAFGRPRDERESRLFLKLDAWHVLDLPLIERAFPSVAWIFLYRHPVEVVASQQRQVSRLMLPVSLPPELFGLDLLAAVTMPPGAYGVHVLASICRAALQYQDEHGRFVNYTELPEAACGSVLDHFGVRETPANLALMRAAARQNAKQPGVPFSDDSAAKQQQIMGESRALVERTLLPLYEELEGVRRGLRQPAGAASGQGF